MTGNSKRTNAVRIPQRLNLQVEESTHSGLAVGVNLGRLTTRISNLGGPRDTEKFDTSYFGVYLRYPIRLGEYFSIQSKLGYRYHSGSGIGNENDEDDIEWREVDFQTGLSARFSNIRLTPFVVYSDVNGDITRDSGSDAFDNDNDISAGLNLDIFLDSTSLVRIRLTSAGQDSAALIFAREF